MKLSPLVIRPVLAGLLTALSLAAPACKSEPTCAEVADHVLALPRPEGLTIAPRDELVANCEAERSPELRRCMLAAKDLGQAKVCELDAAFDALRREDVLP